MNQPDRKSHWDGRYRDIGIESVSWFESEPLLSLELVELVGATPQSSVIDVGGGASSLSARLQQRGFDDLTVLDISAEAIEASKGHIERPGDVHWIHTDILDWTPTRRWTLWHDRAVFHFLTEPEDRRSYRELLMRALEPGGAAIISTFADDGPSTCSGLPVARYTADALLGELGPGFTGIGHGRIDHVTPGGAVQPFTWLVARVQPIEQVVG